MRNEQEYDEMVRVLIHALEQIKDLDGPGLDLSPEGSCGKWARIALDSYERWKKAESQRAAYWDHSGKYFPSCAE